MSAQLLQPERETVGKTINSLQGGGRIEPRPRQEVPPPETVLMELSLGCLVSQALYVAAKLGVADVLAGGAKSVDELAQQTGAHAPSLYRILRSLASVGVFAERAEDGAFELTSNAAPLRTDAPGSLRDTIILMGEEWHWRVWGHTLESVLTGEPAWQRAHGAGVFPSLAANPEPAAIFDRAMTGMSRMAAQAVLEAYDFSGIERLVDVAGGQGGLLSEIVRANAPVRGVLFDLPHVIERARAGRANPHSTARSLFFTRIV